VGTKVIVSDVNTDGGNETVALVKQKGGDAAFARADVAHAAAVEALVRPDKKRCSRIFKTRYPREFDLSWGN